MANKTIDRKRAASARSRAAQATPKAKAARPAVGKEESSSLKRESASQNTDSMEVLEADEMESQEDSMAGDTEETDDEAVEPEDEEEEAEPTRRRAKKRERGLTPVGGQSYAIATQPSSAVPTNSFARFVVSSYRELRLVTWPSRQDTWNWTLVVIGVGATIGILLGATDFGLVKFVTWWLSLAQK